MSPSVAELAVRDAYQLLRVSSIRETAFIGPLKYRKLWPPCVVIDLHSSRRVV